VAHATVSDCVDGCSVSYQLDMREARDDSHRLREDSCPGRMLVGRNAINRMASAC